MSWEPLGIQRTAQPNRWYVNSETKEGIVYDVGLFGEVWKCSCKDFIKTKKHCKHILYLLDHLKETEGGNDEEAGEQPPANPSPSSNGYAKWIKQIRGKEYILYVGLLAMAHEQGLQELHAEFISVDEKLALAYAFAVFRDGRKFYESGDATPQNVNTNVKAHFARVALTRAKARVLRDALNIGMVAVEELEEAG